MSSGTPPRCCAAGENEEVRAALRLPPVTGRGVRVLSMDGGGMKGLVMVQTLRALQARVGQPLHRLFDLVVRVRDSLRV